MEDVKTRILDNISRLEGEATDLCAFIHEHPEVAFCEYQAAERISAFLESHGFSVEREYCGLATAFCARYPSGKPGPTVAILCEYDALPSVGHGCGHNIIATAAAVVGAALGPLVPELGGELVVLGTPAQECGGGGKVLLLENGGFDGIDCAMMFHPGPETILWDPTLAVETLRITFHGKPAHVGVCPEKGVSALEAVIQLFINVNSLRAVAPPNVRYNGIITKGGVAANIIPDLCEAEFMVRADNSRTLDETIRKIRNCATAAALSNGCTTSVSTVGTRYDEMLPNHTLLSVLRRNMDLLDEPVDLDVMPLARASTDAGNVSHVIPTIHAIMGVRSSAVPHTPDFRDAVAGAKGTEIALRSARSLALTVCDLLRDPEAVSSAQEELDQALRKVPHRGTGMISFAEEIVSCGRTTL